MKNFLIGLGLGIAGVAGVAIFGLPVAFSQHVDEKAPVWLVLLFGLSIALMIMGPIYFWLYLPISGRLRRAR
jgi:hypothetical protein